MQWTDLKRKTRVAHLVVGTSYVLAAVTRTLQELADEVASHGYPLPAKYGKQELIKILQDHHWEKENPGVEKPDFQSPMLIQKLEDKPEEEREKIWNSPDWSIELKRNGIRCVSYLGSQNTFTSRNVSVQNYLPESLTNQLFWLQTNMSDYAGTVLDGEVISTKKNIDTTGFTSNGKGTRSENVLQAVVALLMVERSVEAQKANGNPLKMVYYDIMKYKGQDVKNLPYIKRRELLGEVVGVLAQRAGADKVELNGSTTVDKRKQYDDWLKQGSEGGVLKYNHGKYLPGPTRTQEQLKVKKQLEIDAVVTGFIPPKSGSHLAEGLVGGLTFSAKDINTGKWHEIAGVSSLSLEFRRQITVKNPDGTFQGIIPSMYNRVAEIEGFEWTKTIRLSHAKIARWRDEGADAKSPDEAVFDREAIVRELNEHQGAA
jgi:ATP-dependent DNA ligase